MWGGKTNPCLNPIKIMYENWHVNTRTYLISENIAFSTKTPLILLSTFFFFPEIQQFLAKIVTLLKAIV